MTEITEGTDTETEVITPVRIENRHQFFDLQNVIMLGSIEQGRLVREAKEYAEEHGLTTGPLAVTWTVEVNATGFKRPEWMEDEQERASWVDLVQQAAYEHWAAIVIKRLRHRLGWVASH